MLRHTHTCAFTLRDTDLQKADTETFSHSDKLLRVGMIPELYLHTYTYKRTKHSKVHAINSEGVSPSRTHSSDKWHAMHV